MIDILCNERCSKCNHWTKKSNKEIMDYKLVSNFINDIPSLKEVCIVGGEPLIYADMIVKIIDNINNEGVRCVIVTNGVLATPSFIDKVKDKNIHIVFSIDTIDKDFWKFVRGKDTYDIVMKNFQYAHDVLLPEKLSVQSVLAKETKSYVEAVGKYLDKLGIYHSIQNYVSDGFEGQWTEISNNVSCDGKCIANKHNLSIMANGDIYTCFQQNLINGYEKQIGNIRKDDFKDIINSKYLKEVLCAMEDCNLPCKVLKCNLG